MSEVRGSGLECQAVMAQERPRGATLRPRGATALPRSVVAAGRSYPMSEVRGCILSPCLFNFYAEYIMRNAGLEETHAGIKIAGRNINNLRYAHDTTLMAESEEELKSLLMKVKVESEKNWLKAQHSENEDHGIWSHHFMGNRWGNSRNSVRLYFLGFQNHCRW